MQVDDRPTTGMHRSNRRPGLLIGMTAAALVLIIGVIYAVTIPNQMAAPANATQLPKTDYQVIPAGAYWVDTDGVERTTIRGTFVVTDSGWETVGVGVLKTAGGETDEGLYVSLLVAEVYQVWQEPCVQDSQLWEQAGTTPKALGDQFANLPGFITREGLAPVSAFGRDGYRLILEVPEGCIGQVSTVWAGPTWSRHYQEKGQIVELWFLDVRGTTVIVEATRPPESLQGGFSGPMTELQAILDTLVITP